MSNYKPVVDQTGLDPRIDEALANSTSNTLKSSNTGRCNTHIPEFVPKYEKAPIEKVYSSDSINAFIVLGKDRPSNLCSGYGGKGHTQAATVDIVVGRYSAVPFGDIPQINGDAKAVPISSNFALDAARIYISQKTDVDENFGLTPGKVGNSKAKSAIAMKADGIRIIAREGVKIVSSGTDKNNSQGGDSTAPVGVDLIAGNPIDAELEPMVLGNKLVEFLNNGIISNMQDLSDILFDFITQQIKYNSVIASHTHISPFNALIVPPSPSLMAETVGQTFKNFQHVTNLVKMKVNAEQSKISMTQVSKNAICSQYHHLN
jgi:hypothetical protein